MQEEEFCTKKILYSVTSIKIEINFYYYGHCLLLSLL